MSIIHTTAPIPMEELRKYFEDPSLIFQISYDDSTLEADRFLTYFGNLEVPCNVVYSDEKRDELLASYFRSSQIVSIESLEREAIGVLLEYKGLTEHKENEKFIEANREIIERWVRVLDSLSLYNVYMVQTDRLRDWVETFPEDHTSSMEGVNFVSVLKYTDFFAFYTRIDKTNLTYFSAYFNEPIFKGNHLFEYWANENNPMFLLTAGIADGWITPEDYNKAAKATAQEMEDVASI